MPHPNHPCPPRPINWRDMTPWTCPDPECQTRWSDVPENWLCVVANCGLHLCPECLVRCYGCNKPVCSIDRRPYQDSGKLRFVCPQCELDFKENAEPLSGPVSSMDAIAGAGDAA